MSTQPTPETSGRDSQGRFAPGNTFGRGNPHARQVAALRTTLMEKLSPVEMGILVEIAIALAMKGNAAVLRLLFEYGLGRPLAGVDPDRIDVDEFHCLKAKALPAEEVAATFSEGTIPVELALPMIQGAQKARTSSLAASAYDALTTGTLPEQHEEEVEELEAEEAEAEPVARPFPGPVNQRSGRSQAAANRAASTPAAPSAMSDEAHQKEPRSMPKSVGVPRRVDE